MLCMYKANITWLQSDACKEYRASGFQCSSTSVGALALQCAHCCAPCGIRSSSVKCSSAQRNVSHTFLAQHICILLRSKWRRIGFSKAFDSVPVFLTNLSVTKVPWGCCHRRDWSQQHIWSLSPGPWSGKFLSTGLALVQQALALVLTAFIGLQISPWQLRQYRFEMEQYVYIQSQRSLNIQKSFTQMKKTPVVKPKVK